MKLQRLLSFLFAMLLVVSITGCDKDDDDNEPSNRDLLTTGEWTGNSIWALGDDVSQIFLEQIGFDITKNRIRFDKAGAYVDTYERSSLNGTWEFTNNEQAILFDKGTDDEYTARVLKLTSTELHLEQTLEFEDEAPLTIEIRYSR